MSAHYNDSCGCGSCVQTRARANTALASPDTVKPSEPCCATIRHRGYHAEGCPSLAPDGVWTAPLSAPAPAGTPPRREDYDIDVPKGVYRCVHCKAESDSILTVEHTADCPHPSGAPEPEDERAELPSERHAQKCGLCNNPPGFECDEYTRLARVEANDRAVAQGAMRQTVQPSTGSGAEPLEDVLREVAAILTDSRASMGVRFKLAARVNALRRSPRPEPSTPAETRGEEATFAFDALKDARDTLQFVVDEEGFHLGAGFVAASGWFLRANADGNEFPDERDDETSFAEQVEAALDWFDEETENSPLEREMARVLRLARTPAAPAGGGEGDDAVRDGTAHWTRWVSTTVAEDGTLSVTHRERKPQPLPGTGRAPSGASEQEREAWDLISILSRCSQDEWPNEETRVRARRYLATRTRDGEGA